MLRLPIQVSGEGPRSRRAYPRKGAAARFVAANCKEDRKPIVRNPDRSPAASPYSRMVRATPPLGRLGGGQVPSPCLLRNVVRLRSLELVPHTRGATSPQAPGLAPGRFLEGKNSAGTNQLRN